MTHTPGLYKVFIRPPRGYATLASSSNLSWDWGEVCKGTAPRPIWDSPQRLRLFCLVRRRIRGVLICMPKIAHGLLGFPSDSVFVAPTSFRLRSHAFKIDQQLCNTLPEEIVNASSVERFKARLDVRWQPRFPEFPLIPTAIFPPGPAPLYLVV